MCPARVNAALGLLVAMLVSSGCKEQQQAELRSAYDPAADFSRFRSFNFLPQLSMNQQGSACLAPRAMRAIATELQKRGYELEQHYPDLRVNFSCNPAKKLTADADGSAYYEYRYYPAWQGHVIPDEIDAVRDGRGTLNVDLIDASRMTLVWEGIAFGTLPREQSKARETVIVQTISHLFSEFPFHAGEGGAPARSIPTPVPP